MRLLHYVLYSCVYVCVCVSAMHLFSICVGVCVHLSTLEWHKNLLLCHHIGFALVTPKWTLTVKSQQSQCMSMYQTGQLVLKASLYTKWV